MTRPSPSCRPRLAPGCRLTENTAEGPVLLMPEAALRLKGPSANILRRCDGVRTFCEILGELRSEFTAADPQCVEKELADFLEQLHLRRAIDFL